MQELRLITRGKTPKVGGIASYLELHQGVIPVFWTLRNSPYQADAVSRNSTVNLS